MKKYVCTILTILCSLLCCLALGSCGGASIVLDAPEDLVMTKHWVLDWYEVLDATGYVVTLNTGETYETEETQLDMQFFSPFAYTLIVYVSPGDKNCISSCVSSVSYVSPVFNVTT